jgi:hypothetical protein
MPSRVALRPGLYIGDNGRIACEKHSGSSMLYTGYTISGLKAQRVTVADQAAWPSKELGPIRCEECGSTALASA